MCSKPIYVEIVIRAPLDEVWEKTQRPELHERWDLRFTSITYLPRPTEAEPQRFRYATRLGFGLEVRGEGETVGARDGPGGERSSALKFGSEDPKSLIRTGSGYWKYVPTPDGVRFLTGYDYTPRFGAVGRAFDALIFRPLMGWATAWSFDRLRLWLERGIAPETSFVRSAAHFIARIGLVFMWIYQGLVPKLLRPDTGELAMIRASGLFPGVESAMVTAIGVAEILLGLLMVIRWKSRGLLIANLVALPLLALGGLISKPAIYVLPFNPATLVVVSMALAAIGLVAGRDLPSAGACLRKPPP